MLHSCFFAPGSCGSVWSLLAFAKNSQSCSGFDTKDAFRPENREDSGRLLYPDDDEIIQYSPEKLKTCSQPIGCFSYRDFSEKQLGLFRFSLATGVPGSRHMGQVAGWTIFRSFEETEWTVRVRSGFSLCLERC